jgi:hypothetical protein
MKIRHVGDLEEKCAKALTMLELSEAAAIVEARTAEWLADVNVADIQFEQFLLELFPAVDADGKAKVGRSATVAQQTRDSIAEIYTKAASIGDKKGTAYGAYNAVTAYTNHVVKRMDTATGTAADNRFEALVLDRDLLAARALDYMGGDYLAEAMKRWTVEALATVRPRVRAIASL